MSENSPKEFYTNIFMYFDMRGHLDGLFHWRKHYYILYLFFYGFYGIIFILFSLHNLLIDGL